MQKKFILIGVVIVILIFIAIPTYFKEKNNTPENEIKKTVSWDEAVNILNNGKVEEVFQSHSLDVVLILEDGSRINTKEPAIDDIFDEVKKCGEPCEDIILATE